MLYVFYRTATPYLPCNNNNINRKELYDFYYTAITLTTGYKCRDSPVFGYLLSQTGSHETRPRFRATLFNNESTAGADRCLGALKLYHMLSLQ